MEVLPSRGIPGNISLIWPDGLAFRIRDAVLMVVGAWPRAVFSSRRGFIRRLGEQTVDHDPVLVLWLVSRGGTWQRVPFALTFACA